MSVLDIKFPKLEHSLIFSENCSLWELSCELFCLSSFSLPKPARPRSPIPSSYKLIAFSLLNHPIFISFHSYCTSLSKRLTDVVSASDRPHKLKKIALTYFSFSLVRKLSMLALATLTTLFGLAAYVQGHCAVVRIQGSNNVVGHSFGIVSLLASELFRLGHIRS